jgi:hypothetical protein
MRRLILVLACGVLAGWQIGTRSVVLTHQRTVSQRTPIEQPSGWVAFSADFEHREKTGRVINGRYYRGSDGSYRREGIGADGRTKVSIVNLTRRIYYRGGADPDSVWQSGPYEAPEVRFKPQVWFKEMVGLSQYPYKLALLKGQDGSLTALEGLDAWIYTNYAGTMRLVVPALNFHAVVNSPVQGMREVYSNIVIGNVDPALFEAPPNRRVQWTGRPFDQAEQPRPDASKPSGK